MGAKNKTSGAKKPVKSKPVETKKVSSVAKNKTLTKKSSSSEEKSSESSKKLPPVALTGKQRIQTAEGWKRMMLKQGKTDKGMNKIKERD